MTTAPRLIRVEAVAISALGGLLGLGLVAMVLVNIANAGGRYGGLPTLTGADRLFQAFDVPGLFQSPEEVAVVIHNPEFRDHLETLYLDKGVRVIGAIPTPLALSEVTPQLQSGGIDGMLAGMPILTAFKFYDTARHVTDLNFSHLVSMALVNEMWFQNQSSEVREAIRAAGRAAEEAVFDWGVTNVERANGAWLENGGEIHRFSDEEQADMMTRFADVGVATIADQPDVVAEYERILDVLKAHRGM